MNNGQGSKQKVLGQIGKISLIAKQCLHGRRLLREEFRGESESWESLKKGDHTLHSEQEKRYLQFTGVPIAHSETGEQVLKPVASPA